MTHITDDATLSRRASPFTKSRTSSRLLRQARAATGQQLSSSTTVTCSHNPTVYPGSATCTALVTGAVQMASTGGLRGSAHAPTRVAEGRPHSLARMAVKPQHTIRRFDVFAEYQKQEQEAHGVPTDRAKGYGLWIAKVVAAGRSGRRAADGARSEHATAAGEHDHAVWHELDGQPQTDEMFDAEIVWRMGLDFYREVFEPAIRQARAEGRRYESVRDAIRRSWRPDPA